MEKLRDEDEVGLSSPGKRIQYGGPEDARRGPSGKAHFSGVSASSTTLPETVF